MSPRNFLAALLLFTILMSTLSAQTRIRDYGLELGVLKPGPLNAITDVKGVKVGQVTIIEGDSILTAKPPSVPSGEALPLNST